MKQRSAFTLIELLIVVAIIAILAAIAVPNFLEAQVRSKVSRTRADIRTIAVAIESYAVDHTKYPWVNTAIGYGLPPGRQAGTQLAGMTTPIAYITSILKDPFGGKKMPTDPYHAFNTTAEYWYWTEAYMSAQSWANASSWATAGPGSDASGCKWALMSQGPDLQWSHVVPPGAPAGFTISCEVDKPLRWAYDSTNGTISWGNIARTGP
ncbi:hypothetical protein CVU37_07185 [candidate division BRC1 bacterium HGW-BRC1-1]|jgi:prepilin-type N-terminal cleavage/methylation domain-containing protein|nr:MAG: hypothetical protein CVU37_07185 [candidate division BRC1 bacterium HGW-BRC1-1]